LQAVVDNGVEREYEISSYMPSALPKPGDTITVDTYTGVLGELIWQADGELETMTVKMIDYNAAVLQ
jgi:hypothetical protein